MSAIVSPVHMAPFAGMRSSRRTMRGRMAALAGRTKRLTVVTRKTIG
jgi:hypothetical protein